MVLQCRYDALGRRVEAIRADGTVDRYIYFPGSFLVLAILDGSNNPKELYTRGPDLSGTLDSAGGIGGILACTYSTSPTAPLYYHADIMGNIIALTDALGSLGASFQYTSFGQISAYTGDISSRYLFSSKELDAGIQLLHYGYRDYMSHAGRWLTRDPIGERDGPNLFGFVGNALPNKIDYLGLLKVCCRSVMSERWYERMWRHCEIMDKCLPSDDEFDVWTDDSSKRKLDNGTPCCCATEEEIAACLRRHPYSSAPRGIQKTFLDWLYNNCQTSTILTLGHCCLKSTWKPNWYAGNIRGKCKHGHYILSLSISEPPRFICDEWEVPNWQGEASPQGAASK